MTLITHYRTFKQDCPAHISLRADDTGTALVVRIVCDEHCHDLSQVMIILQT